MVRIDKMAAAEEQVAEEMKKSTTEGNLTTDEAEQYDRQIRLWGLDAQKRLRASSVLVVGARGLGAELSKNIVLAGVQEVKLLDHTALEEGDTAERFLMQKNGVNRAQQAMEQLHTLNPNVHISADTSPVEEKDDEYLSKFDVVVATCCRTETLLRLNKVCRDNGIKFFCGDVWGYYGYFFTDLGEHEYAMEVPRKTAEEEQVDVEGPKHKKAKLDETETVTVKETCSFCSLEKALSTDWSKKPPKYFRRLPSTYFIIQSLQLFRDQQNRSPKATAADRELLEQSRQETAAKHNISTQLIPADYSRWASSELSPVCAVVGGVLGQEVIKAISAKDRPYMNSFLYDGRGNTGIVELLHP